MNGTGSAPSHHPVEIGAVACAIETGENGYLAGALTGIISGYRAGKACNLNLPSTAK
jgi:hypothetical protein